MRNDDFFAGLFAALRESGVDFLATSEDEHHDRFGMVAELLAHDAELVGRTGLLFIPSPYNGRFAELDSALLRQQIGLLGAQNPFYPGVHLQFSEDTARELLKRFPEEDAALFRRLAQVYINDEVKT